MPAAPVADGSLEPLGTAPELDGTLAASAGPAATLTTNINEPSGTYLMRSADGTRISLPSTFLNDPDIDGFVLRDYWARVNPARGVYDFSRLDEAIRAVTAAGKEFKLTIFTGISAPAWLYAEGAQSITFTESGTFRPPGTYTMPVPWDEVMLTAYEDLLREMDRHFGSHPNLTLVSLGGPTQFSLEMHLPPSVRNLPGYSADKIVAAWDRVLTTYSGLFPNVRGAVQLANPFQASDGIAARVAADTVRILGQRAALQHDALSAKPDLPQYNIHQIVVQYGRAGVHVGFEELTSSANQPRFGGTFDTAWQRVLDAGARYFDIYQPDIPLIQPFPDAEPQPPNSPPTFTAGGDVSVGDTGGSQTVAGWATDISAGPSSESGQVLQFVVVANSNAELFSVQPRIDAQTGDLTFSIPRGRLGSAVISVALRDSGGTLGGGSDTSGTKTFTLVARPFLGDMDGNGVRNNFDLSMWDWAITNPAAFLAAHPNVQDYALRGDLNGDGRFDNFDTIYLERILTGGLLEEIQGESIASTLELGAETELTLAVDAASARTTLPPNGSTRTTGMRAILRRAAERLGAIQELPLARLQQCSKSSSHSQSWMRRH